MIKKIVCFDPPYSNYFNDISCEIENIIGCKIEKECFTFNKANKIYLSDFNIFVPRVSDVDNVSIEDYLFVSKIKSLSNITGSRGEDLDNIKSDILNYKVIEEYIVSNKESVFLLYNDLRWQHAFAIDILKRENLKYFVFERGVFRPYSTTIDSKGVNANSRFCSFDVENNIVPECDKISIDDAFFVERRERPSKIKFFYYFMLSAIYRFFYHEHTKISSKTPYRKNLANYISLQAKILFERKNSQSIDEINVIDKDIIFVPLQLSNDTQTLINSSFRSTQEFIDFVYKQYVDSEYYKSMQLVFKMHPLDVDNYKFPPETIITNENTLKMVSNSKICVTINSTVGFEAIPFCDVICLGKSFYTEHGLVNRPLPSHNIFSDTSAKGDFESYKYQVLQQYQVPGSVYNYQEQDVEYASNKIINYII
ncbi:capsular polysaccharide export protein, LipB/KpsS family [Vibrio cyclitrophicus]|uniref:capsular polysaccharide export protein, LipB/KpsS family n=1 Tax=Vibrio cyclitrophicus TaxID=47951 RepID=UPI0021C37F6C|nr:hypothetical protein [Vibrio cyclitrophicus]